MNIKKYFPIICFIILCSHESIPQVSPLTPRVQSILFSKIFKYIRTLDSENIKVLVIYEKFGKSPETVVGAFKEENISAEACEIDKLTDNKEEFTVVYFMDGIQSIKLKKFENENILTIAGDPAIVESGYASIGVGVEKEKPVILINIGQLRKESQQVSSELLNLAKVIR